MEHDSSEAVLARANQTDPIIMYLIVRKSIGMSIGKTAAQVGHAAQMLMLKRDELLSKLDWCSKIVSSIDYQKMFEKAATFNKWLDSSFRKVVLMADEKEWEKIKQLPDFTDISVIVVDAGLTELQPHTETVIGLFPMHKTRVPKIVKRLQTLK